VVSLFANPELIRNARAQLRLGRMLSAAGICAVLSLTAGYAFYKAASPSDWAQNFLMLVLGTQVVTLALGGSISCLQSVSREKELNTFDFQRVTRLTPLELAIGKLFGAPILTYFVAACLLPAALFAAVAAGTRPTFLLAALVVILLGSITMHAFALTLSMLMAKGLSTLGTLGVVYLMMIGSIPSMGIFSMGKMSPFFALDLISQTTWSPPVLPGASLGETRLMDEFFGVHLHHFWVAIILYAAFSAWFLLALARNLKRDPSTYQMYSPRQSLLLAFYLNFLFIGFFNWSGSSPLSSQSIVLTLNWFLFSILGLALLYNRDHIRRRVRRLGEEATNWLAATWPASYMTTGMVTIGVLATAMFAYTREPKAEWDLSVAIFRVLFAIPGMLRDILFLQWLNLTRSRGALMMGFLYLIVYYSSVGILLAVLDPGPGAEPLVAALIPYGILALGVKSWATHMVGWVIALMAQLSLCGLFTFLHRQKLLEIAVPPVPAPAE
jgi:hypothetical protein